MTLETRGRITEQIFKDVLSMAETKGAAYAQQGDTLDNFKKVADATGQTMFQVWQVYFQKHILSINNAIMADPDFPVEHTEGMEGRILDAVTYLTLLQCLLTECGENRNG
jgi:hypothetical protein